MTTNFASKDIFSDAQTEFMITDLRDILGRLKKNNVLDYLKENAIRLLDSKNTSIEFRRTEYTEIKRFISLVRSSLPLLTHLTRNPTSITVIDEVERQDRIMGSMNIQKTILANKHNLRETKTVICNEIHRTVNSPENQILACILFSISLYCDRYISKAGLLNSGTYLDSPTLNNLSSVRNHVIKLLSSNIIKCSLPYAITNTSNIETLFRSMIDRIFLGKVPNYFTGIYNLLHKWKYFIWVSARNFDLITNTLRYHFFSLKKYEELYECWVFYKILDLLTEVMNFKLKETTSNKGIASFRSRDGSIKVTYQRIYETGWMDKDEHIHDKPDIVIEFKNSKSVILDAKNSILDPGKSYPYLRQMDSYIRSSGVEKTNFGIFIFSSAAEENWKEIKKQEQKIMWMGLSPGFDSEIKLANEQSIENITQIIKLCAK
jgi:hypothetical protein